ncbi:hypothetical protein ARTHROSP310_23090 [Arthrobacter sp. AD-310]
MTAPPAISIMDQATPHIVPITPASLRFISKLTSNAQQAYYLRAGAQGCGSGGRADEQEGYLVSWQPRAGAPPATNRQNGP